MRIPLLLALVVAALLVQCGLSDTWEPPGRNVREALASLLGAPLDQLPEAQLVAALDAGTTSGYACSFAVCLESPSRLWSLLTFNCCISAMLWPCAMARELPSRAARATTTSRPNSGPFSRPAPVRHAFSSRLLPTRFPWPSSCPVFCNVLLRSRVAAMPLLLVLPTYREASQ